MNKIIKLASLFAIFSLFILIGCDEENSVNPVESQDPPSLLKVGRTVVWADGTLYNSVVIQQVSFKPENGKFDKLYAAKFKDEVGLISESKPGDTDYNGGRWNMNVLKEGIDPNKYINASSDGELDLDDFEEAGVYFECPLQPRRGRN